MLEITAASNFTQELKDLQTVSSCPSRTETQFARSKHVLASWSYSIQQPAVEEHSDLLHIIVAIPQDEDTSLQKPWIEAEAAEWLLAVFSYQIILSDALLCM